jgi:hypothetical protein
MNEDHAGPGAPGSPGTRRSAAGARKNDPGAAERLAAALRENLHRRKQQARGRKAAPGEADEPSSPASGAGSEG